MHCPYVPIVHLDPLDTPASTCTCSAAHNVHTYRHATEAHAPANTTSARAAWNTLAQLHQPCRCVARFESIAAVVKPSRRGAPSSTAAAPKGSMFSLIICSCHRPRRGAPGCSWSSAVASVQVLDALQRSTFAGTPAADAGHPCGHQKRAHF